MNAISQREITRWIEIVNRKTADGTDGIDRLRRYICSMTLGRKFGQSAEEHIASRGLTEFVTWARELQN